jgi:hypothetical protein
MSQLTETTIVQLAGNTLHLIGPGLLGGAHPPALPVRGY